VRRHIVAKAKPILGLTAAQQWWGLRIIGERAFSDAGSEGNKGICQSL
jgi:hypothetical protein